MIKKIDVLRHHMANNDWQKAISLANKFPKLGEIKKAIEQAHMAYTNPNFCRQIKKDPTVLIENGIKALKIRYS